MNSTQTVGNWWRWWIMGYPVMICAIVGAMFSIRRSSVPDLSSPKAISAWQTWKEDVREQQTIRGTVERRIPKSDEPPALVLMRDYFGVLMLGALLFSSVLYWIMAWFVTGIFKSR